jgi:hypothetical protein
MAHVLVHCREKPVNTIWSLARTTWPHSPDSWPQIDLGIILGCGSIMIPQAQGNEAHQNGRSPDLRGATHLLQILISESAHLIWVLRCERVIQERSHNENEIKTRWYKAINTRLTNDRITATKIKRNKKFTRTVSHTWDLILRQHGEPPYNWLYNREVLVGRMP